MSSPGRNRVWLCPSGRVVTAHYPLHSPGSVSGSPTRHTRTQGYPASPPKLRLCTLIPHPNVFNHNFVCLDMLRDYESYGWR
jgi:hypothetical protein